MLSVKLQLSLGSLQFMDESVIQIPIPFLSAFLKFSSRPPFKCLKIQMNQIAERSELACCLMLPKKLWKSGSTLFLCGSSWESPHRDYIWWQHFVRG